MVATGYAADDMLPTAGGTMTGTVAMQGTPPFTLVNGLYVGKVTLNGTTAVVVTTAGVDASSVIQLTVQPGAAPVGFPYVFAISAGVSFSVKSTNAADTAVICGWQITEHA